MIVPGANAETITDGKPPNTKSRRRELAARVLSAVVLAPLAIAAAYIGGSLFGAFWLIGAVGIWWEWNGLVSGAGNKVIFALGAATLVSAAVIAEIGMNRTPMLLIALGALAAGVFAHAERRGWAAGGLLYAGAVLSGSIILRGHHSDLGFVAMLILFAVVWSTDTFAFFVGRLLGGPKLAPAISPNKTWSGAIGGAAGAMLAAAAVAEVVKLPNIVAIVAVALLLSVAAQMGDLFESAIKRRFGAKDTSHLIPGHGGFMDRLDGYTAAVTVAALLGVVRGGLDAAAQGLLLW